MKKLIFHDLDGNILDDFSYVRNIVNEMLRGVGSNRDFEYVRNYGLRRFILSSDVPFMIPFIFFRMQRELGRADIDIVPGMKETIKKLNENDFKQVILTNNSYDFARRNLERNDIDKYFSDIFNAGFLSKGASLKKLCSYHGIDPKDAAYITDECRDVRTIKRRNGGINIIGVTWGFNSRERLAKANPHYIVDSPQDLSSLIVSGNIFTNSGSYTGKRTTYSSA